VVSVGTVVSPGTVEPGTVEPGTELSLLGVLVGVAVLGGTLVPVPSVVGVADTGRDGPGAAVVPGAAEVAGAVEATLLPVPVAVVVVAFGSVVVVGVSGSSAMHPCTPRR
jgi:hypothetical protein